MDMGWKGLHVRIQVVQVRSSRARLREWHTVAHECDVFDTCANERTPMVTDTLEVGKAGPLVLHLLTRPASFRPAGGAGALECAARAQLRRRARQTGGGET